MALFGTALLTAGTITAALLIPGSPSAEPVREAQPVLAVQVARPRSQLWSDDVAATGRLVAWDEASIGSELGELRLIDIRVDVGDRVRKGQLLAQFDRASVQAELNERIALLAEAQALLAEADENARRGESLRGTGALSHQVITQYITRAHAARAQVDSAQARVDSSRLRLQQTRVLAPDDGVISARTATLGGVGAVGTELFRLIRQNRIEWHARVAASRVRHVAVGQTVTMSLPDGSPVEGMVRQIAPILAADLTATVYVQLLDQEPTLARIGMYLQGVIVSGESQALTIPASSIVVRDGREYAFAVTAGSNVVQLPVKTGRRHGAEVEVLAGLPAEQAIVVNGGGFLHDGDLVRIVAAEAGGARASSP
jgi:RND family efflux transporter MFP subunit